MKLVIRPLLIIRYPLIDVGAMFGVIFFGSLVSFITYCAKAVVVSYI